jgi:hypothetical protein
MSCPIFQALADDTLQRYFCPSNIVHAKRDPVGIAKIEFAQVSVQMLFAAMLINTDHAPLED